MNNQIQLVLKSSTDEISLNDHELGIYLTPDLDGLVGLPEIRTTSGVNAGYDGGWTSAQNYDARSITIKGVIANTDVATVESLRKKLVSLAGQGKSEELTLDLVTEAGNAYTLQVRTIALDMAMQSLLNKQEFMLQLRADDPLIYDASETTHEALIQVAKATGGFQINFELPLAITGSSEETVVENNGLERVPTITRLYGALHNPKIINHTTNQFMQLETDLGFSEGQWITPSDTLQGKIIEIENAPAEAPLASFQLDGETSQNGTPTPSAPVAVQTVTGENAVKICGKNLFDKTAATLNYRIGSDGSPYGDNNYFLSEFILVNPSTQYRITPTSGGGSSAVAYYDSSKTFISRTMGGTWYDVSTPANCAYIRFTTLKTLIDSAQCELGSTATAYEPYQGQSYEVNLGKNLLDPTTLTSGYVDSSGNPVSWQSQDEMKSGYLKAEPNTTYTFSIQTTSSSYDNWFGVGEYTKADVSGFIRRDVQTTPAATSYTFTTSSTCQYIIVSARNLVGATEVQLEKSSQATSYAAYFEPIELCKIGDYQDYIYKSGEKWYVHKAVGKCQLDGAETWGTATDGYILAANSQSPFYDILALGTPSYESLCSHFYFQPNAQTWTGDGKCGFNPTGTFWVMYAAPADKNAFLAWLGQTKPSIYFPLATPVDEEITNEALIAQLEALLNTARTYAGVNNIFTITPNEQGTMEIRYYTEKTQDYRDVVEIDSRLRTITLNGLDIYHLQTDGSDFLMLAPGENRLSLQSDITGDNGYAEVSYKQGYLSI